MALVTEILLYLLFKLARGDFLYWIKIDGVLVIFVSFLLRVIIKALVDWTAVVQFRHPNKVGGFYFFVSLGLTIVMGLGKATGVTASVPSRILSLTLILLARYFTPRPNPGCALNYDKESTGGTLDEGAVVAVMSCACAGLALSFGSFCSQ